MTLTLREINLVFDTAKSLAGGTTTFAADALGIITKLKPFVDKHRLDLTDSLVTKHGQRDGELDKFKIKTKEQFDNYKADVISILDTTFDIKFKSAEEENLLKQILLVKLMFYVGDFLEI